MAADSDNVFIMPANHLNHLSSPDGNIPTSMVTPVKQVGSSGNVVNEVRKRTIDTSSGDNTPISVKKKLLFSSPHAFAGKSGLPVSRCIFGPSTAEQDQTVLKAFDEKVKHDYNVFINRYEIVEELKN